MEKSDQDVSPGRQKEKYKSALDFLWKIDYDKSFADNRMEMFEKAIPLRPLFDPVIIDDDSWLEEEIEQEEDEDMKRKLQEIKRTMRAVNNQAKRKYVSEERERAVELEHYNNDMNTTEGFEVGNYPNLLLTFSGLIIRYYCPPDTTVTDDRIGDLTRVANVAIQHYNSQQGTSYGDIRVIKTMKSYACGTWYYLTFRASLPDGDHTAQTFEAKLFEHLPLPTSYIEIDFVRLKKQQSNLIDDR